MSVEFINSSVKLPSDSLTDIQALVAAINQDRQHPFGAKCVDVDIAIDTKGKIVWSHSKNIVYGKNVQLVSLKKIMENEKD